LDADPRKTVKEVVPVKLVPAHEARQRQPSNYLVHQTEPTRRTTVAVHSGDLPARDVQDILRQTRISREEFLALLR
jgi:hypothetical protein